MWIQLNHRTVWHFIMSILLITNVSVLSSSYDEFEELRVHLELIDMDLEDQCDQLSTTNKNTYLRKQNFSEKIKYERQYGKYLRWQINILKKFEDIPEEMLRNWTLITSPGNALLSDPDWIKEVVYSNSYEEISRTKTTSCSNATEDVCLEVDEQGMMDVLSTSRNESLLENTWLQWTELFSTDKEQFISFLQLIPKAAVLNKQDTPKAYWDMLVEYEFAIDTAQSLWNDIEPFYKKLHKFVQTRLFNEYEMTDSTNENIPIHLLGSFDGSDWSKVADMILPHPHFYREANRKLKGKTAKEMYKTAEDMSKKLQLGKLGSKFYENSVFNSKCSVDILSYCTQEYSEIMTCNKTNWHQYVEAHKTVMAIALRSRDYMSYQRSKHRLSSLQIALEELATIIAIENLPAFKILPQEMLSESDENYDNRMTILLLLALKILPSLSYYLVVDKWRLSELENPSDSIEKTWWELRNNIQMVSSTSNTEWDFLADYYVRSNQPYIGKYLGTIMQFQILDNLRRNGYYNDFTSLTQAFKEDPNFLDMIQNANSKEWPELANYYYGISEISATPLLEFFKPLEEYMEKAPLEQGTEPPTTTVQTTTPESSTLVTVGVSQLKNVPKRENLSSLSSEQPAKNATSVKEEFPNDATNSSNSSSDNETTYKTGEIAMYFGIGLLVAVAVALVGYIIFKKRKRPVTNNRRFET